MTDILPEMQSNSGQILKAARGELSLTIEQVANELHLRPSVVRAIEDENYDEFSSDVFLKGYFRTYCRLVKLDEALMMEILEQQLLVRQKLVEQQESSEIKQIKTQKRRKVLITFCVFSICILLVGAAYYLTINNSNFFENEAIQDEQVEGAHDQIGVGLSNEAIVPNVSLGSSSKQLSPEEESIESANSDANMTGKSDIAETSLANTQVEENVDLREQSNSNSTEDALIVSDDVENNVLAEYEDEALEALQKTAYQATINAKFSGECWFQLTDFSGKKVIADLKKANDEINFTGFAPFQAVIGDTSKIILFLDGKLIDLKPFSSKNGYAKFTLMPSVSDNEG